LQRQTVCTVFMSLLLVGLGFLLGQYYAISRGMLWEAVSYSPAAPKFSADQKEEAAWGGGDMFMGDTLVGPRIDEQTGDLQLPSRVDDLHMDKLLTGEEALEHSRKIFGAEAPIRKAFVPYYSSGDAQGIVWILKLESACKARQHVDIINSYIKESETFTPCGSFFLQNVEVHHVEGLNFNNYYYSKDNYIYWISLAAGDPVPLFLKFYEKF